MHCLYGAELSLTSCPLPQVGAGMGAGAGTVSLESSPPQPEDISLPKRRDLGRCGPGPRGGTEPLSASRRRDGVGDEGVDPPLP